MLFKDLLPCIIWIHKLHFCYGFGFHLFIADYKNCVWYHSFLSCFWHSSCYCWP